MKFEHGKTYKFSKELFEKHRVAGPELEWPKKCDGKIVEWYGDLAEHVVHVGPGEYYIVVPEWCEEAGEKNDK